MPYRYDQSSRRTKVLCTIGPASCSESVLRALLENGVDCVRLNFSHGNREEKLAVINRVKQIRRQLNRSVGILQDLSGPKIRVASLDNTIHVDSGDSVYLTPANTPAGFRADGAEGTERAVVPVDYSRLLNDVPVRGRILIDDGRVEIEVSDVKESMLVGSVIHGGAISEGKGVNFPGISISERAPTKKDLEDLQFGVEHGVDYVALSFVQDEHDIERTRSAIRRMGGDVGVIAKLERESALQHLDAILDVADGVMVARGDLGIETSLFKVPVHQKRIVKHAIAKGRFVITATQMLGSMMDSPTPTRAEVSDVANAVYDGTDALMLSGETAIGSYPVESAVMMREIAAAIDEEVTVEDRRNHSTAPEQAGHSTESVIADAACTAAVGSKASYIVAQTLTGRTAGLISTSRPSVPILGVTPRVSTFHRLSLVWGVRPVRSDHEHGAIDFVETVRRTEKVLLDKEIVQPEDIVVHVGGSPAGVTGGTNTIRIRGIERLEGDAKRQGENRE